MPEHDICIQYPLNGVNLWLVEGENLKKIKTNRREVAICLPSYYLKLELNAKCKDSDIT